MSPRTLGTGAPWYSTWSETKDDPDDTMMVALFDIFEPTNREFGGKSPSLSIRSSRRYKTIDPRPTDESGNEYGSPQVLCTPRPSVAIVLSTAAVWAALTERGPIREKCGCRVAGRPGRSPRHGSGREKG